MNRAAQPAIEPRQVHLAHFGSKFVDGDVERAPTVLVRSVCGALNVAPTDHQGTVFHQDVWSQRVRTDLDSRIFSPYRIQLSCMYDTGDITKTRMGGANHAMKAVSTSAPPADLMAAISLRGSCPPPPHPEKKASEVHNISRCSV